MRSLLLVAALFLSPLNAAAQTILPGFSVHKIADTEGFVTSIAFDGEGRIFYSASEGEVFRLDGDKSILVAKLPTASIGNAVLLGIAFRGEEIIAHYVKEDLSADILAEVDPATGKSTILAKFACETWGTCSSEHHGGNPVVAPNGDVYVGIGDYGGPHLGQLVEAAAGKIWKLSADGTLTQFARGFRNPFDFAIHPDGDRLIVGDNGPEGDDEITVVRQGENHGWGDTMGNGPTPPGYTPPVYVFPGTVAPTGVTLTRGLAGDEATGLLVASFVTKAIYFFPDIDRRPFGPPVIVLSNLPQLGGFNPILDVAQTTDGTVYFATPGGIWKLVTPEPGDVNGDGKVTSEDLEALAHELVDGDGSSILEIHNGGYAASWAADVNRDGVIDSRDLVAWVIQFKGRARLVERE